MNGIEKRESLVKKYLAFFEQGSKPSSEAPHKPVKKEEAVTKVAVSTLPPISEGSHIPVEREAPKPEKKSRGRLSSFKRQVSRVFRPSRKRSKSKEKSFQLTRTDSPSIDNGNVKPTPKDDFEENRQRDADFFSMIEKMVQAYARCRPKLLSDMVERTLPQLHQVKVRKVGQSGVVGTNQVVHKLASELLAELFREALKLSQHVRAVSLLNKHKELSVNLDNKEFLDVYCGVMMKYHDLLQEVCYAAHQFSIFFDFGKTSNEDSKVTWIQDVTVTKEGQAISEKRSVTFDFFTETAALFQRFPKQEGTFKRLLSKKVVDKHPEAEKCFQKILADHSKKARVYKHRVRLLEITTSLAALHKQSARQPFVDRLGRL